MRWQPLALLALCLASCARTDPRPPQLVVVGLDGMTFTLADPLMAAGRMPNLAAIVREGTRAELRSMEPMFSPRLWTTMATGVPPESHGVTAYVSTLPGTGFSCELELDRLPASPGRLRLRLLSEEPQCLRVALDGMDLGDHPVLSGWQDVVLAVPARARGAGVLRVTHERRRVTGARRAVIGGDDEAVAHTAGYDVVIWESPGESVAWDLGDYGRSGDVLKSGFYVEREVAEDGRDFHWSGREISVPVTSHARRVPAVWNVLGDAGRRVLVIGHWATWPAEEVNGVMVSDRVVYSNFNKEQSALDAREGQTFPPGLVNELARSMVLPERVPADLLSVMGVPDGVTGFRHELDRAAKVRAALTTTVNYRAWARMLLAREQPDYAMVYFDAPDVVSHADFAGAAPPGGVDLEAPLCRIYGLMDEILGELRSAARPGHRVLVVSDHGFERTPDADLAAAPAELRAVNAGRHQRDGVLAAAGPGIARGRTLASAGLLDVMPTVLDMMDVPAAEDMPGKALPLWTTPREPLPRIPSHGARRPAAGTTHPSDDALKDHMRSLGYIE